VSKRLDRQHLPPDSMNRKLASRSAESLAEVLRKSTSAGQLVEECGNELAQVNASMQRHLADPNQVTSAEVALKLNQAVEEKVASVADKLATVNSELSGHVRDRHLLKHQLAVVVKQEAAARHLALHDVLTGLPNRALFDDRLEHGLAQALRHRWSLALMFIDLDGFKRVNDNYGHRVGDLLLQTVAQRLRENTRSDDTVGRYGGDEFVYLLMEVKSEQGVAQFAERLVAAVHAPCEFSVDSVAVRLDIRASIGISLFPQDGHDAETLLRKADAAMYQAKQSGSSYAFAV